VELGKDALSFHTQPLLLFLQKWGLSVKTGMTVDFDMRRTWKMNKKDEKMNIEGLTFGSAYGIVNKQINSLRYRL
jgi:hypothetical protein